MNQVQQNNGQIAFSSRCARLCVVTTIIFLLCCSPVDAYAEGGVELAGSTVTDGETDVSPEPYNTWKFAIWFSKNVSYASEDRDDSFIESNLSKVKLQTQNGSDAEGYVVVPGGSRDERQVLYILTEGWLEPLTEYQIVIEPGLVAANGIDASEEEYVITFKTSSLCENQLTVFQNALFIVIPVVIVAGVIAALIKRRKDAG